jgi:hypothetical protein
MMALKFYGCVIAVYVTRFGALNSIILPLLVSAQYCLLQVEKYFEHQTKISLNTRESGRG